MATNTIISLLTEAEAAVNEIVARLVSVDAVNGRYRVSLPISMPSGSLVDVSVYPEPGGTFLVSDAGLAYFEASTCGASRRSFSAVAKPEAQKVGAVFDGEAMLVMRVTVAQLRGAIIMIGNLAAHVATETVERHARARAETAREALFDRVERAFDGRGIAHDVELLGESTAAYHFDVMVETNGHRAVFDTFTRDPISIAATYTKLSDVHRTDEPPTLVAVTPNPDAVGPKLTLISSVAKVIRLDASPITFKKAAA